MKTVNIAPSLGRDGHFTNRHFVRWQREYCYSAPIRIVHHGNLAAVRFDNGRADRQPETQALRLGRVERLEHPDLFRRRNAGSTVLYAYLDRVSLNRAR